MKFWVIHGPNLGRLGARKPEIYGSTTLDEVNNQLAEVASGLGASVHCVQHNSEGSIIDSIEAAVRDSIDGIVINPAAYSHTSIAIHDAIEAADIPVIEVHLSNVHAREDFRRKLVTAAACEACISGCGVQGYAYALSKLAQLASKQ